jgi:hypothetical protein
MGQSMIKQEDLIPDVIGDRRNACLRGDHEASPSGLVTDDVRTDWDDGIQLEVGVLAENGEPELEREVTRAAAKHLMVDFSQWDNGQTYGPTLDVNFCRHCRSLYVPRAGVSDD